MLKQSSGGSSNFLSKGVQGVPNLRAKTKKPFNMFPPPNLYKDNSSQSAGVGNKSAGRQAAIMRRMGRK